MSLGLLPAPAARVEHLPLSRLIHQWLRDAILTGALAPGQVLRQQELAKRFNASRVPLREALSHLEAEGLVVLRPRRGFAVTSLETSELLEIFQLRMIIEEHGGYVACLSRTEQDVRRLETCLEQMNRLAVRSPTKQQLARLAALNQDFHDILISASRRRHLQQISANLRAKIEPYIRLEVAMTRQFEEAHADHHAILAAFKAGDAAEVARLSREHCERTALRFIRQLHATGVALDLSLAVVTDTGPVPHTESGNGAAARGAQCPQGNGRTDHGLERKRKAKRET
jgi:DNA-binding GntR family transcriptional regulator